MKLYLARHGDYTLDPIQNMDVLSEKGMNDVLAITNWLKPLNLSVASIWHSSKNRAQQTAGILAAAFTAKKAAAYHEGLEPDDDIDRVTAEIQHSDDDMVVVGHLPFMSKLTSHLLIGDENRELINFATGSLVCLSQIDKTHWVMDWMLTPDMWYLR